ncbi:competence type IV pilus minor pilin ComGG [Salibacterium aidingense]|uniref:competence type IV pilus minor pilin ComGG n=1 Tax=Salibacterium aidingense TaxID=384933 RepID=UPI0004242E02|nr:competence type IV pilus minor pilin ComGG [Salibacterium aidingense]
MGEKGTVMPAMLIFCFLLASLLLFQIALYSDEKQSLTKEEQVLRLEWLLRNAEQQWKEDREKGRGSVDRRYQFPRGEVQITETPLDPRTTRIDLTARNEEGQERTHYFYLELKETE